VFLFFKGEKMKTRTSIICFTLLVFILFILVFNEKQQNLKKSIINIEKSEIKHQIKSKIIEMDLIFENDEQIDREKIAYTQGYINGQNALFSQMNEPIRFVLSKKYFSYILQIESDKNLKEIISKGYVDGYHKACSMLQCPVGN
jgi:hypothetical protein